MIAFILTGSVGGLIVPREINAVTSPPTLNIQEQNLLQEIKQSRAFLTNQVRGETLNIEKIKILSETHGERGTLPDKNTMRVLPDQLAKQISDRGDSDAALQKALQITNQTERTNALKEVLAGQQEDLKDLNGYLKNSGPAYTNILNAYTTEEKSILSSTASRERSNKASEQAGNAKKTSCELVLIGTNMILGEVCLDSVIKGIAEGILQIFGFILWGSAQLFDLIFKYSVVDIATHLKSGAITSTWKTTRDLANMFFIFILLFAAINFVLGKSSEGKKMVTGVLFIALVINFSLFFTRVVVDISNTFTIAIHNQILETTEQKTLSSAVAQSLKITTIFDLEAKNFTTKNTESGLIENTQIQPFNIFSQSVGGALILMLGGSAFFFVTAFVLFSMAFLFLTRLVVIYFLMILSPLAFASSMLPGKNNQLTKWTASLMSQAVFAPIFMLLFYLTLQVATKLNINNTTGIAAALAGGDFTVIMNFAIIIIFMIATMIISKQAATESGGLTAKAFGVAEKLRSGTQGFVGRNTFGRVGARLESEMDKRGIGSSRIGQFTRSYTTGALAGAKFGGGTSRKDIIGKEEGREKEREGRTRVANRNAAFVTGTRSGATDDDLKKMHGEIKKLSTKDLETMDFATLNNPEVLLRLSSSQMKSIRESEKLTQVQKDSVNKNRENAFETKAGAGDAAIDEILNGKPNEVAKLPAKFLTHEKVAPRISAGVLSAIHNDREMTDENRNSIRNAIEGAPSPVDTKDPVHKAKKWITDNDDF